MLGARATRSHEKHITHSYGYGYWIALHVVYDAQLYYSISGACEQMKICENIPNRWNSMEMLASGVATTSMSTCLLSIPIFEIDIFNGLIPFF